MRSFGHHIAAWWNSLVSLTPDTTWKFMWVYAGLIIALLVLGILSALLKPVRQSLRERISLFAWSNFWIGIVLFFFRFQRLPLLGMDLLRFVHEISLLVWLALIVRFVLTTYRKEALGLRVEEYRTKYLPKAKAKKLSA